jgi:hypothetical protein
LPLQQSRSHALIRFLPGEEPPVLVDQDHSHHAQQETDHYRADGVVRRAARHLVEQDTHARNQQACQCS